MFYNTGPGNKEKTRDWKRPLRFWRSKTTQVIRSNLKSPKILQQHKCSVANIIKLSLSIIYATGSVFPNDFEWGYADSDRIMSNKVLLATEAILRFQKSNNTIDQKQSKDSRNSMCDRKFS
jgi:hypothetical protein